MNMPEEGGETGAGLSDQHVSELLSGLARIQRAAMARPLSAAVPAAAAPLPPECGTRTCDGLSLAYSVTDKAGFFVHLVSGHCGRRPQAFIIQSMLFVMMALQKLFNAAGFAENEVELDLAVSESGTHYFRFILDEFRHAALRRALDSSGPPA
ncbi:MAG: hypothetical protein HY926_16235 [Elusimicrobia bacterium]|nr:hypothetical protein [Elusimicrobiota bacterium]